MSLADLTALSPKKLARFWARVNKVAPHGCWLWTGATTRDGYGILMVKRRHVRAHRVSWALANGAIPFDLQICHRCDVHYPIGDRDYRRCINPAHLFVGTNLDNHLDAKAKGRKASGGRNGARRHIERMPRGENNGNSRLTTEAVRAMRRERVAGETLQTIARRHHTTLQNVSRVCSRQLWQHVD